MTDEITMEVDRAFVGGDELPDTIVLEHTETGETQRYDGSE